MRLIDADALIEGLLEARHEETETTLKLVRFIRKQPTIEPNISGKMIDADAFAEAIESLDWYSLHNGKMIQGAEGSDNAYYKASDIYTEINKAVTIRADVIEPKRGRWIMQRVGEHDEYCVCSECGNQTESDEAWNYCPNCGADMRGEK